MRRICILILLSITFAAPVWTQEDDAEEATDAEQPEVTTDVDEAEVVDEPIVDDEFYQDVDDEDFRPSEDIPADQSIPFPSDI